jgi:hypothetical protein
VPLCLKWQAKRRSDSDAYDGTVFAKQRLVRTSNRAVKSSVRRQNVGAPAEPNRALFGSFGPFGPFIIINFLNIFLKKLSGETLGNPNLLYRLIYYKKENFYVENWLQEIFNGVRG